jgi:hypothetical protein
MKSPFHWLALAGAAAVLAGCASDPAQPEKVTSARNPCTGEAPATGTMLRKKEDCGADKSQGGLSQAEIDEIRRASLPTKSMASPAGGR